MTWECEIVRGRRGVLMLRRHWGLRPSREMTMTSVAVAPGSLGAPPAMLTPKMYHLQQGCLSPTSGSSTSGKVSRPRIARFARCDARESVSDARRSYDAAFYVTGRKRGWNLIRGWSLYTAIVATCGGFLRRSFLWYRISPCSLIATCSESGLTSYVFARRKGHWFFPEAFCVS